MWTFITNLMNKCFSQAILLYTVAIVVRLLCGKKKFLPIFDVHDISYGLFSTHRQRKESFFTERIFTISLIVFPSSEILNWFHSGLWETAVGYCKQPDLDWKMDIWVRRYQIFFLRFKHKWLFFIQHHGSWLE